jgi:hypothetical protein
MFIGFNKEEDFNGIGDYISFTSFRLVIRLWNILIRISFSNLIISFSFAIVVYIVYFLQI